MTEAVATADLVAAPFRGERFADPSRLTMRLAPPYDVLEPTDRASYAGRDPHNIVHVAVPHGGSGRYAEAGERLRAWRAAGLFVRDAAPEATVVRQTFVTPDGGTHARTGVILGLLAEPFSTGRVRPHERTHAGPKADRLALLQATHAMFEALLVLARDADGRLQSLLTSTTTAAPDATATLEGDRIAVWRVAGKAAWEIASAASANPLYIADGHHRYETAVAFRSEMAAAARLPALIVPRTDPGLVVLPTHRIVRGRPVGADAIAKALRHQYHVRELAPDTDYLRELAALRTSGTACVVVLPDERALALLLQPGAPLAELTSVEEPAVAALDVARVDATVLRRVSAVAGPDAVVEYSADPSAAVAAVRDRGASAAVLLNPIAVEQMFAVADAGAVMPQKSTYFLPKVPSGLVIMGYD